MDPSPGHPNRISFTRALPIIGEAEGKRDMAMLPAPDGIQATSTTTRRAGQALSYWRQKDGPFKVDQLSDESYSQSDEPDNRSDESGNQSYESDKQLFTECPDVAKARHNLLVARVTVNLKLGIKKAGQKKSSMIEQNGGNSQFVEFKRDPRQINQPRNETADNAGRSRHPVENIPQYPGRHTTGGSIWGEKQLPYDKINKIKVSAHRAAKSNCLNQMYKKLVATRTRVVVLARMYSRPLGQAGAETEPIDDIPQDYLDIVNQCNEFLVQYHTLMGNTREATRLGNQKPELVTPQYITGTSIVSAVPVKGLRTCIGGINENLSWLNTIMKMKYREHRMHFERRAKLGKYLGLAGGKGSPLRNVTSIDDVEEEEYSEKLLALTEMIESLALNDFWGEFAPRG
ncbi:hypothetical protein F4677DRAFT_444963 [Hypoxylon crocopeplum]|nr:hypothetical protein F4677DRAFT_444963 [Hypoxylon crocopeplum]